MMTGLAHGSSPAARFDADLTATRALAASERPVTVAPPDSRSSAEVAIHVAYIIGMNVGCGALGGWVATTPAAVAWAPGTDIGGGRTDGTIAGVPFRADYQPGRGWQIALIAC